jgi:hypothetical protein
MLLGVCNWKDNMQELTSAGKTLPLSKSLAYGAALCVAAMAGTRFWNSQ